MLFTPGTSNPIKWQLLTLAFYSGCAQSGADRIEDQAGPTDSSEATYEHPHVQVRLLEYSGSLCPEDSLAFSANDGTVTIVLSREHETQQRCRIVSELTVPPGGFFDHPRFYAGGIALELEENAAPSTATLTYSSGAYTDTSIHTIPGLPLDSDASDSFLLLDTPELHLPVCEAPSLPTVVELVVELSVEIPEGNYLQIFALDWNFDDIPWARCEATPGR